MLLYNQVFMYPIIVSPIVVCVVTCLLSRCLAVIWLSVLQYVYVLFCSH
jgi:hypothetical protein